MQVEILPQEKNQPIHQWVYQVLRTNIIKIHLKPAQRISENEISEALGVSRTPVREAFIRLAEDGLIKITPQKRSSISLINLEQAEEARFVRMAVEKAVMREACGSLSAADLEAIGENIREQQDCHATKAYDRMLTVDNEFHRLIFRSCRKERSWLYLKKLDYNYDRLRIMAMPVSMERIIMQHRRIRDVLAEGRRKEIDETVNDHMTWQTIREVVNDYPNEYFLQDLRGA